MDGSKRLGLFTFAAIALGASAVSAAPVIRFQQDLHGDFLLVGNVDGPILACDAGLDRLLALIRKQVDRFEKERPPAAVPQGWLDLGEP